MGRFVVNVKSQLGGIELVFKHITLSKCLISYQTHMITFYPLEVVGRGGETQLQVVEKALFTPSAVKQL